MSQLMTLAWKEWREAQLFLWLGLGIFLGLPILGGVEAMWQYSHRFELQTSPWVIMLGGVFGLFLAIALTCRDLQTKLEDFWRSRPMGTVSWFLIKYLVGLAVTIAACELPLLAERWVTPKYAAPFSAAACIPFMCMAIYSIAFLIGCLLRRPAHAAMVSFAGMLLLLFLPVAIPPLRFLTVMDVMTNTNDFVIDTALLKYAGGMLGICVVLLIGSLLGVSMGWKVSAGKRLMYGSVAAVVLIMFGASGYQLGTNLTVLAQVSLGETPANAVINIDALRCDNGHGYILSGRYDSYAVGPRSAYRTVDLEGDSLRLGQPRDLLPLLYTFQDTRSCWAPGHPEILYTVADIGEGDTDIFQLVVTMADGSVPQTKIDLDTVKQANHAVYPMLAVSGSRLFAIGNKVNVFDISDNLHPKLFSSTIAPPWPALNKPGSLAALAKSGQDWVVPLMPIDGLNKEGRFQLSRRTMVPSSFDGEFFCVCPYPERNEPYLTILTVWKLKSITDESATFSPIGTYEMSLLEEFFGADLNNKVVVRDGLAYVWPEYRAYGFVRVTVFDLHSAHPLSPVGHFSAPRLQAICPLPDGRALLAGESLWLVGPPPTRR